MVLALILAAALDAASPSPSPSASATPVPATAPSPTPSATPTPPVFRVPSGWKPAQVKIPIPQGYTDLGSFQRTGARSPYFLNVISGPSGGLAVKDYAAMNVNVIRTDKRLKLLADRATTLCGGRPAWLTQYTISGKYPQTLTQIFAVSPERAYVMTYTRLSHAPDAPGIAAIEQSLCVPTGAAYSAGAVPFTVPGGWREANPDALGLGSLSSGSVVGVWLGPQTGDFAQTLNLAQAPGANASIADAMPALTGMLEKRFPHYKLRVSRAQQLCGKLPGWYLEYDATMQNRPMIVEQTIYMDVQNTFALTYGRLASSPEDASAHTALISLCPAEGAQAG